MSEKAIFGISSGTFEDDLSANNYLAAVGGDPAEYGYPAQSEGYYYAADLIAPPLYVQGIWVVGSSMPQPPPAPVSDAGGVGSDVFLYTYLAVAIAPADLDASAFSVSQYSVQCTSGPLAPGDYASDVASIPLSLITSTSDESPVMVDLPLTTSASLEVLLAVSNQNDEVNFRAQVFVTSDVDAATAAGIEVNQAYICIGLYFATGSFYSPECEVLGPAVTLEGEVNLRLMVDATGVTASVGADDFTIVADDILAYYEMYVGESALVFPPDWSAGEYDPSGDNLFIDAGVQQNGNFKMTDWAFTYGTQVPSIATTVTASAGSSGSRSRTMKELLGA